MAVDLEKGPQLGSSERDSESAHSAGCLPPADGAGLKKMKSVLSKAFLSSGMPVTFKASRRGRGGAGGRGLVAGRPSERVVAAPVPAPPAGAQHPAAPRACPRLLCGRRTCGALYHGPIARTIRAHLDLPSSSLPRL